MNLLDSHDTERLLWTLTPGQDTTADKEANAANVAAGKQRVRLASLIQYTMPGAPTVYYGDEVGVTGDDDPDDRRTYPWADLGGSPDTSLLAHYTALAAARRDLPVLRDGDFRALLADDGAGIAAYGRQTASQAAIVVINRGASDATVQVPVGGWLPRRRGVHAPLPGRDRVVRVRVVLGRRGLGHRAGERRRAAGLGHRRTSSARRRRT